MEALERAHGFGVGMAAVVEPGLVVESRRFHDERVAIPLARGIAVPSRIRILGLRPAVGEDLAVVGEFLVKEHGLSGALNQLEGRIRQHRSDDSVRQAVLRRAIGSQVLVAAFVEQRLSPGLKRNLRPRSHVIRYRITELRTTGSPWG